MLDNLLEIELTYSLLKQQIKSDAIDQKDPLDINYEKLKTDFSVSSLDIFTSLDLIHISCYFRFLLKIVMSLR